MHTRFRPVPEGQVTTADDYDYDYDYVHVHVHVAAFRDADVLG